MTLAVDTVADKVERQLRDRIHASALAAAAAILGPDRGRDADAFGDMILARFDEATNACRKLELLEHETRVDQVHAAAGEFMRAIILGTANAMVDSLRLAVRGCERGRTQ